MRIVACLRGVVTLALTVGGWVLGCSEEFTSSDAAAGAPSFAGAGDDGGEPANGGDGAGRTAGGQGGAPDAVDGGRDSAAGATGAGGDTTSASDPYRDAILADHPLVYWRMGRVTAGAVPDETGGGNDLVLQGTGHELDLPGALASDDRAIGFDGVASFAVATNARALDFVELAPFTLECWAQRETGGTSYFQHLLSNVEGVANNRDGYALYLLPEPAQGDTARSVFERDRPAADLGIWGSIGKVSVWTHYAAVFDGLSTTLYVNGTLAKTVAASGGLAPRKTPFTVGRGAGAANYFRGAIDEIAVYPKALSAAVIATHLALAK